MMEDKRKTIGPTTVGEAIKAAKGGYDGVLEFVDELHPYLVLRVRGHSVSWLVKTRERTKKIGTPLPADATIPGRSRQRASAATKTLTLRDARDEAKREWPKLYGTTAPEPKPLTWTWAKLAEEYKQKLHHSGAFDGPIVTQIVPFTEFFRAEDYHQNYYNENSQQPYCRIVIGPKLAKLKKVFHTKLKPE